MVVHEHVNIHIAESCSPLLLALALGQTLNESLALHLQWAQADALRSGVMLGWALDREWGRCHCSLCPL